MAVCCKFWLITCDVAWFTIAIAILMYIQVCFKFDNYPGSQISATEGRPPAIELQLPATEGRPPATQRQLSATRRWMCAIERRIWAIKPRTFACFAIWFIFTFLFLMIIIPATTIHPYYGNTGYSTTHCLSRTLTHSNS